MTIQPGLCEQKIAVPGKVAAAQRTHWPHVSSKPSGHSGFDDVVEDQSRPDDLAYAVTDRAVVFDVGDVAVVVGLAVRGAAEVRNGYRESGRAGVGKHPPHRMIDREHPPPAGPQDAPTSPIASAESATKGIAPNEENATSNEASARR